MARQEHNALEQIKAKAAAMGLEKTDLVVDTPENAALGFNVFCGGRLEYRPYVFVSDLPSGQVLVTRKAVKR